MNTCKCIVSTRSIKIHGLTKEDFMHLSSKLKVGDLPFCKDYQSEYLKISLSFK